MEIDNKMLKQMSMFGQSASIFGLTLPGLIGTYPNLIVACADQANPAGLDSFRTKYPDKFFNVGIAEQNMIGMAAGLAELGRHPICVAQACFITMRAFEQVRQYCGYMKYPLILIGLSSGFGLTVMGNTHYALEDIALMRSIPGMSIATPANELQAVEAFKESIVHDGPVYIRLNGFRETQLPMKYTDPVLQEGEDLNIIACGSMAFNALKAAEILKAQGIHARVYNCKTAQPLPDGAIVNGCPLTVTVEEHRQTGGLGDAVASEMATTYGGKLLKIGVQEDFPMPGSYKHLLQISGLTPEAIAERIETKLNNQINH